MATCMRCTQVQHVLAFPAGSVATDALVPGARFLGRGALCDTELENYDYVQGMYMGSFGNPTVWATDGVVGVGMLPLDDAFETHAHIYQRAIARWPSQPRRYLNQDQPWALKSFVRRPVYFRGDSL